MVEVSEVFQQPKFQSLCHDPLFHCRCPFVFCLWYLKETVILIIYSFFLCFTAWSINVWLSGRNFQYFGCKHYQPGKRTLHFLVPMIEYLVATSYELWIIWYVLYFVALMTITAEIVVEKSSICKVSCWFWVEKFS